MRALAWVLAAVCALAAQDAAGFEGAAETSARVYFTVPMGAASGADAGFGLRLGVGDVDLDNRALAARDTGDSWQGSVDVRFGLDGAPRLLLNDVAVAGGETGLGAADDDDAAAENMVNNYLLPGLAIGVGVGIFVGVKHVK